MSGPTGSGDNPKDKRKSKGSKVKFRPEGDVEQVVTFPKDAGKSPRQEGPTKKSAAEATPSGLFPPGYQPSQFSLSSGAKLGGLSTFKSLAEQPFSSPELQGLNPLLFRPAPMPAPTSNRRASRPTTLPTIDELKPYEELTVTAPDGTKRVEDPRGGVKTGQLQSARQASMSRDATEAMLKAAIAASEELDGGGKKNSGSQGALKHGHTKKF